MWKSIAACVLFALLIGVHSDSNKKSDSSEDSSQQAKASTDSDSETSSNACSPYPDNLKSLEECCDVPEMFDEEVRATCEYFCSKNEKDSENPDCPIKCLIMNNKIMKQGEINQTAMALMFSKFGLADPLWKPVIQKALQACPLEKPVDKSWKDNFDDFEECTKKIFLENCVEGKDEVECDAVEDFMKKCQSIEPDCDVWPRWIVKLPEYCCNHRPELFDNSLRTSVEAACADAGSVSNLGSMQCIATELLNKTKIRTQAGWDFKIAKDMLMKNAQDKDKWKQTIEKSVRTCEKQVQDDTKSGRDTVYLEFWFYECIKGSLADFCPEYSTDKKQCRRIKKFKAACPDAVPPRKDYMTNGKM